MKNGKYLIAVALLAVLAVVFGLAGTVAPPLAEEVKPSESSSSSSSSSVAHFANPPTYDSGWVNMTSKKGQYVTLDHNVNSSDVFVDITGKQSLKLEGALKQSQTFGASRSDVCTALVQTSDGGYALAGTSSTGGYNDVWLVKTDVSGNILWNNFYGGEGYDYAYSLVQTTDGGYAISGHTTSFGNCPWLIKTDSTGKMQWNRTYFATGEATARDAYSIVQTSDGGYVFVATISNGTKSNDFWLVKTDSDGNMGWNQAYGGQSNESPRSVVQTTDGGYAMLGFTDNYPLTNYDFWFVKTDSAGNSLWNKTYGGSLQEYAYSLKQTADGGYILCGSTESWSPTYGRYFSDRFLVKTNSTGYTQWSNGGEIGSMGDVVAYAVIQTANGGYAWVGTSTSWSTGKSNGIFSILNSSGYPQGGSNYGRGLYSLVQTSDGKFTLAGYTDRNANSSYDFLLVRSDSAFDRTYDGGYTKANSVIQTSDGGYAVAGCANSYSWLGSASGGFADFWVAKTDSTFAISWGRRYGGSLNDIAYSLVQTADGGYLLVGSTESYGAGKSDFWLLRIDGLGNQLWSKTLGSAGNEAAYSLVQTSDGGFAIAGSTDSYGAGNSDFWLVKTDSAGNAQWNKTYGGSGTEVAYSLIQTSDGGFALGGFTDSFGTGHSDFWLVKTDLQGNALWSETYGGASNEKAHSLVQTGDGGFALGGYTDFNSGNALLVKTDSAGVFQWNYTYVGFDTAMPVSLIQTVDKGYALTGATYSPGTSDFLLLKSDLDGKVRWNWTYGGAGEDVANNLIQTSSGDFILVGQTDSWAAAGYQCRTVRTSEVGFEHQRNYGSDLGLTVTALTNYTITIYRGSSDPYWNYVRVRIWLVKEPSWIYGDINMDGVVDAKDLYIVGRNYGKTFSLLSLGGIVAVAGIRTAKKRKQTKQPSYIS